MKQKSDSRTANGKRNIVAGFVNRVIMIVLPFVARSVILATLGKSYLGLGSLFTSILKVLNLSELGFGSALVFSMYKPIAENDTEKVCALLNLYKKIYRIIGAVILGVGLCLMPFVPKLIKGGWPDEINIYLIYFIYLINASVSYFAFAYKRALLTAHQKSSVISNINSGFAIIIYAIQIGLLYAFHNYYIYACLLPVFAVIENLFTAYITDKYYPEIKCKGTIPKEEKSAIKDHVKGIALQKICSTSRNSFDSIVISMYLGLVSIGIYNNYYQIMSSVHLFLYQIPNAIRASAGNSVAKEPLEKNYKDFCKFNFIYLWIGTWCCTCLICLFQPFMKLWMGEDMLLPISSVILFCIYFVQLCMSDMIALYKDAAGLWWHGRYRTVIEAIANLILNFVLGYFWGINGILIASIVTMFFIGFGYGGYIVFRNYFKAYSLKKYFLTMITYMCLTTVVCSITLWICNLIDLDDFLLLFVRAAVCVVLPNIILSIIYYRTAIFKESFSFFKSLIMRTSRS